MQETTISISSAAREYVEEKIAGGEHSSPMEVIDQLVNEERKRRAMEYLRAKIRDAEAGGEPEEITPQYWAEVRKEFHEKYPKEQAAP